MLKKNAYVSKLFLFFCLTGGEGVVVYVFVCFIWYLILLRPQRLNAKHIALGEAERRERRRRRGEARARAGTGAGGAGAGEDGVGTVQEKGQDDQEQE